MDLVSVIAYGQFWTPNSLDPAGAQVLSTPTKENQGASAVKLVPENAPAADDGLYDVDVGAQLRY